MKRTAETTALLALLASLAVGAARAETPVSMELVLAIDTSISVDEVEYRLMMGGVAAAFRSPEIIRLIERQNGVAVALFQWATLPDERSLIGWDNLKDAASAWSFAAKVESHERSSGPGFTGIGEAIDHALRLIAGNGFDGLHRKIDVSGDGRSNAGRPVDAPKPTADALGVIINGLPIVTTDIDLEINGIPIPAGADDLDAYYRDEVIHGPGAFVEVAYEYDDFARAFLRKLRRELAIDISRVEPSVSVTARDRPAARPERYLPTVAPVPLSSPVDPSTASHIP